MDLTGYDVVAEPTVIEDAQERFPGVLFAPVAWNNPDPCSGCVEEEGPWDPPAAEAFLVYRWRGHWIEQPVAGCCLESELACLFGSEFVSDLQVQVLVFSELKAV